jgi:hypothetical protein
MTISTIIAEVKTGEKTRVDFVLNEGETRGKITISIDKRFEFELETAEFNPMRRRYDSPLTRQWKFMPVKPKELETIRKVGVTPKEDYVEVAFTDGTNLKILQPFKIAYPHRHERYI